MEIYHPPGEKGSFDSCGEISSEESQSVTTKKICSDCGTSKTPLWRGGPCGPKSLCNACGIRSRKKRRAMMNGAEEKKPKRTSSSGSSSDRRYKYGDWLKEVLKQRSNFERQKLQLGEEEQAAVVLMALSYGSVYA